ncbi:hydrogenase formation protein HypD [Thermodesulfobacteriota bacterium]
MAVKYMEEYRDPAISRNIVEKIKSVSRKHVRLMEVCGTHTTSLFRNGIRSILPDSISLLSGPGCPVCVTSQSEIDAFIALSGEEDVIITTFGDLMRVPGTHSSLQKERAEGKDIRMVYSTFDAMVIAKKNPGKKVVFLGVGFETTAPTIAAAIISARDMGLKNFYVFSAHKLIPPALAALLASERIAVDGFMLPGHVSVIIGSKAYLPLVEQYHIPCAIAGFEPADMLQAIFMLVKQAESGTTGLENAYPRAVSLEGNEKAQWIIEDVFETVDVRWRGLGTIPESGLKIREEFSALDAQSVFELDLPDAEDPKGCACGEILTGTKSPPECSLYRKVCTPEDPVGPCMVSSEGTCAAYFRYHGE